MEVQVVFRSTSSTQFARALELARREPTFRESAGRPKEYSVVYTQDTLERYRDLMAIVGRWSQTRVFLNKQPVDRERLDALVACYLRRLAAPDRRAYCAGAEVHETRVGAVRQLFPCRMIPISECNHRGWFQYGRLTRDKVFLVDKAQLRQAVYDSLDRTLARHCPALFLAEVDSIIDKLPDRIDPSRDPQWTWKEGWQNGHFMAIGVEKRLQPAPRAAAGGPLPVPRREVPQVRWRDIGGLGPQIQLIRENLELPLRFPELFARLGIEPHRGLLLAGPPGTGKTLIAKALASECQAHFCFINGPEVLSKWHGESEANLRRVFDEARALQPSVILIDEIDSIAPERARVTHNFEAVLVSQLLALMDGLFDRGRVVVVGTTNRPENVDSALLRPGRLDLLVEIGLPDRAGRAEILRIHTRRMPLAAGVDLDAIAAATEGYAGADLAALCREAGFACMRQVVRVGAEGEFCVDRAAVGTLEVRTEHFLQALERVGPRSPLPRRPRQVRGMVRHRRRESRIG